MNSYKTSNPQLPPPYMHTFIEKRAIFGMPIIGIASLAGARLKAVLNKSGMLWWSRNAISRAEEN